MNCAAILGEHEKRGVWFSNSTSLLEELRSRGPGQLAQWLDYWQILLGTRRNLHKVLVSFK